MAQTLAEKIIARAAGKPAVAPGDIVTCSVDLALMHDSGGPRRVKPILERLGARVWDPTRVIVVTDHFVPVFDSDTAAILDLTRRWVVDQDIRGFYDKQGICHIVLPERGHLRPGLFVVGGDSHSPTGGAFGCFMFGIGATDMAGVLVTGETWLRVPSTILIEWDGRLQNGVVAKDMMLRLCGDLGLDGGGYGVVQFAGPAIESMPMQERMTLCNMTAELGAMTGLIEPDETTGRYLAETGADLDDIMAWRSDPNARYGARHSYYAGSLAPQVAAPHSPANARDAGCFDKVDVDVAYIGACTGAKLTDLRNAARVLKGRKVASGVRLLVAPASLRDRETAEKEGTLSILIEAGASLLASACGLCAGYGEHRLDADTVCISSTARNFQGRMGAPEAKVYLASPFTVAASAVAGRIADPRDMLQDGP